MSLMHSRADLPRKYGDWMRNESKHHQPLQMFAHSVWVCVSVCMCVPVSPRRLQPPVESKWTHWSGSLALMKECGSGQAGGVTSVQVTEGCLSAGVTARRRKQMRVTREIHTNTHKASWWAAVKYVQQQLILHNIWSVGQCQTLGHHKQHNHDMSNWT